MSNSMIATIYLIALVVFFLLLVVLTITLIAGKSRRNEENETDGEEDIFSAADNELADNELWTDGQVNTFDDAGEHTDDTGISDETYVNTYDEEIREEQKKPEESEDFVNTLNDADTDTNTDIDMNTDIDAAEINGELKTVQETDNRNAGEAGTEINAEGETEAETETGAAAENEFESESKTDAENEEVSDEDARTEVEQLVDSAFAPEPADIRLTNEELDESVREAVALGAAVASGFGTGFSAADMFGVQEELDKSRRKVRGRSSVPSTDDFYWYNRLDITEKPSYKPAEMYYHYFDTAKDCIEDLLIEMYDCALVRTEEIRYIAYGIEPRAISIQEILSSGNYVQQHKVKEPTTQDLVRIYEKWCSYVDKLFDKVEIHADAYTIDEIRNLLCEFGRNDVDVLLEGK